MAENFISRLLNLHSDRAHRVDPTTPATPTPELFRKVLSSKRRTRNCQGLAHFSPSSVKPWIYFPHPFPLFSTYSLLSNSRPTTTTMLIMRMFLTWNRRNEIHGQIFMQPIILHGFVERGQGVVARVGIRMEISPFHSLLGYKLGKIRKTRSGIATVQLFWERERVMQMAGFLWRWMRWKARESSHSNLTSHLLRLLSLPRSVIAGLWLSTLIREIFPIVSKLEDEIKYRYKSQTSRHQRTVIFVLFLRLSNIYISQFSFPSSHPIRSHCSRCTVSYNGYNIRTRCIYIWIRASTRLQTSEFERGEIKGRDVKFIFNIKSIILFLRRKKFRTKSLLISKFHSREIHNTRLSFVFLLSFFLSAVYR